MARPRKSTNVLEILRLRLEGFSWPQIAHSTGLGQGTVYRAYRKAIDALKPFQNPKAAKLKATTDDELPAGQDLALNRESVARFRENAQT